MILQYPRTKYLSFWGGGGGAGLLGASLRNYRLKIKSNVNLSGEYFCVFRSRNAYVYPI